MKWIWFTMFFASVCAAQTLQGIGPFRPRHAKVSIIDSIAAEMSTTVAKAATREQEQAFRKQSSSLVELVYDPTVPEKQRPVYAEACPLTRVFYLSGVSIAGVPLRNLVLRFYRDFLYQLECDPSEQLRDAMEAIYGEPEFDQSTYRGDHKTIRNKSSTLTWSGTDVDAVLKVLQVHDKRGRETVNVYFTITYLEMEHTADRCSEEAKSGKNDLRERLKNRGFGG